MNITKIILVVLLTPLLISQPALSNGMNEIKEFKTIEGEISITGTEPLLKVLLSTEEANYTISGELADELKNLTEAKIRVTGEICDPKFPGTENDIKAFNYKLLELNFKERDWALGNVKYSKEGYVLIGEDQVIYELKGFSERKIEDKLENKKSVLIGDIEFINEFEAKMDIESYKVISD